MKKCLSVFLFLFMGTIVFAQENFSLPFSNGSVIADGDPHDWTTPLKHYDINTRLFFDFKNDSNNLYLCFQTNDIATQTKLLRAGMKITLSSKINGKHKATIGFPDDRIANGNGSVIARHQLRRHRLQRRDIVHNPDAA